MHELARRFSAYALMGTLCSVLSSTSAAMPAGPGASIDARARPATTATTDAAPRDHARLVGVHLLSRVRDAADAPADAAPKRARAEAGVMLYAVLEVEEAPRVRRFYSDAGRIRLDGRVHDTVPMDRAPRVALRWYKVEPTSDNLSNTATGSFRFEEIPYAETLVAAWSDRGSVPADVRPTRTPDRGDGVGTMRFKLVATAAGVVLATPGVEARAGRGGLGDRVHRVSLRRDDSYLGMLTELFGQPYIWASGGQPDARHQTELMEGADCADFVVYGMRRLGHRISYTWSEGLRSHGRKLGAGTLRDDGVYVDAAGTPLRFPRPGDLVIFPRHVGALSQDRGVPGVLDRDDLMMHTLFASPREESIAASGYADTAVEIRRWMPGR
jgi:cell wall-associated NlpC family hydrolase